MQTGIPVRVIEDKIFLIRGHKVMLDQDLALVYGVSTKRLNQQVQRNMDRFPLDFMFKLTPEETKGLRLHFATLENAGRGRYRKYLPYVFTEYGAVMISAVLKTPIAVHASIQIARTFVKLREFLSRNKVLERKLEDIDDRLTSHDGQIYGLYDALRKFMKNPRHINQIGFRSSPEQHEQIHGAYRKCKSRSYAHP